MEHHRLLLLVLLVVVVVFLLLDNIRIVVQHLMMMVVCKIRLAEENVGQDDRLLPNKRKSNYGKKRSFEYLFTDNPLRLETVSSS